MHACGSVGLMCKSSDPRCRPQVMGKDNVVGLLKRLRPKVFLPLVNAEFDSEGPLSSLISEKGNVAGLPDVLKAEGLTGIELVVPEAGKATSVVC